MTSHSRLILQDALKEAQEKLNKVLEENRDAIQAGKIAEREVAEATAIVSDFKRNIRRIEEMESGRDVG